MSTSLESISLVRLAFVFVPVFVVVGVLFKWRLGGGGSVYAVGRMLLQLLLVGYVLAYIFETNHPWVVGLVLACMLAVAAWIALRPVRARRRDTYWRALLAISLGGLSTLVLVTQSVLDANPWFAPRVVIPLAGMIFANAMNTVSLAAERFESECSKDGDYVAARRAALGAAMIPMTNALLAVGLVSLPGMMTGQILSGVPPLVAARYQIMVMAMVFGSAGIAATIYLLLVRPRVDTGAGERRVPS
jgi:putative ABC transport system permease protein